MSAAAAPLSERACKAARSSFEQWALVVVLLSAKQQAGAEEMRLARQIWASAHGCIATNQHSPIGSIGEMRATVLESVRYLIDGYRKRSLP